MATTKGSVIKKTEMTASRKCYECGEIMVPRTGAYHYIECGLSKVSLLNITIFECKCGSLVPEIPAIAQLHRRIAVDLIRKNTLLIGEEIKFLRKMAGLNAVALAYNPRNLGRTSSFGRSPWLATESTATARDPRLLMLVPDREASL